MELICESSRRKFSFRVHQRGRFDAMLYNLTLGVVLMGFLEYLRMLYALVF